MPRGTPNGITKYSDDIPGARGNYNWSVRYDLTDGYLGISQMEGERVKDRVLLSPKQVGELVAFVSRKGTRAA